ncbi:MAG TPA: hypothetical protein PLK93_01575 [Clostridiales bacterium]|nr:hypothetical protein [Clostridiales bacterium]HPP67874.1 hypothetical protein [Clostridiales bacterium]
MKLKVKALITILITLLIFPLNLNAKADDDYSWVGAWHTSPVKTNLTVADRDITPVLAYTTVRSVITVSLGGDNLRLCLTNKYGNKAAYINRVYVAKTDPNNESSIIGDLYTVRFGGSKTLTLGREFVYSDPIDMKVEPLDKISISIYFTTPTTVSTAGLTGGVTYIAAANQVKEKNLIAPSKLRLDLDGASYYPIPFVTSVDVDNPNAYSVVMIGDSSLANRVPNLLSEKLINGGTRNIGVLQSSIAANRLLTGGYSGGYGGSIQGDSAVSRFDDDALKLSGVKKIFVKVGANDILHPKLKSFKGSVPESTAADIIRGYESLISKAVAKGIEIYFFGITPFKGYGGSDLQRYSDAEKTAQEVNTWLKNNRRINGYIDIDKLRDPADSAKLRTALTTDGLNLNNLGQIALTDLIPLEVFGLDASRYKTAAELNRVDPYKGSQSPTAPTKPAEESTARRGEEPTREDEITTEPVIEDFEPIEEVTEDTPVNSPGKNNKNPYANLHEIPGAYRKMSKKQRSGIIFFTSLAVALTAFGSMYYVNRKKMWEST